MATEIRADGLTSRPGQHRRRKSGSRLRSRIAAIPFTLWVISGLWTSLLLGASVLWPASYGYDEASHIDMAYAYSVHPFHFYGPGQLQPTAALDHVLQLEPGYPPNPRFDVASIAPRGQRPTLAELGGHTPVAGLPDQMVQHPPLYYELEALIMRIPGVSHLGWDLEVWLMRLLSVAFLVPLPLLCWATTRRLLVYAGRRADSTPDHLSRLAVVAAVVPLTIPNLIRDGSSVTNDSLLILATSVVLYLLSRVVTGDLSRRTAGYLAVALAVALLTKGFALFLPVTALAAYLVGGWQAPSRLRAIGPPLAVTALGCIVGGLWWLRNLIDYGTVQVDGYGPKYASILYGKQDNHGTIARFIPQFATDFTSRIWGGIGLPDTPSPGPFVIYGWLMVVMLGVVAALFVRADRGGRLRLAVLTTAPIAVLAVVAGGSAADFQHWSMHRTNGSQGRYLYQTLPVIAALATIGWFHVLQPRLRAALLPITAVGAVLTNAVAWLLILRSWYQPANALSPWRGLKLSVSGLLRWSPLPEVVTLALVVILPAATSVVALVVIIREARALGRSRGGRAESVEPEMLATV